MPGKVPAQKLANYYINFSSPSGYKDLIIKNDTITKNLKSLISDNIFNIVSLSQQLENKNKIENVKNYKIAWCHEIPLLTNSKSIKFKSFLVSDFLNYKFQGDNTQRTEKNYIEQFNAIINNITPEFKTEKNLNFFINNHLEIFYKCLLYRNDKKQSLDSFKNDVKLIVKFLKMILGAKNELYIKYSVLLSSLSRLIEFKEKANIISSETEIKNFTPYEELLKIQDKLNIEYDKAELDTPIIKLKNNEKLFMTNQKLLLFSWYILFPPFRGEIYDIKIIKNEKDKDSNENTLYIKDSKNIILYLNGIKKKHDPIKINLNDDVLKSYSKNLIERLINLIYDSLKIFPREWLFINTKGNKASQDTLKDWINSIIKINIPNLRSSYISYWYPKINRLQKDRLIAFMRTSSKYAELNYLKQYDITTPDEIQNIGVETSEYNNHGTKEPETEQETEFKIKTRQPRLTNEQRVERRNKKNEYHKKYYDENKEQMIIKAKENSRANYGRRLIRELNNNSKDISTVKDDTLEKWNIKYNSKTKLYYIDD